MATANKRLASLDLLRGFDLFCLLMLQPILMTRLEIENSAALEPVARQFTHVEWQGVAFWDLIMPLFMFMSGITIPFAMSKYRQGETVDRHFYLRLFKRFFVLFFLGWVVQGNLLALDIRQFHIFANTLQAIAVGYVVAALLYIWCSFRTQIGITALCFIAYLLIFATAGGDELRAGEQYRRGGGPLRLRPSARWGHLDERCMEFRPVLPLHLDIEQPQLHCHRDARQLCRTRSPAPERTGATPEGVVAGGPRPCRCRFGDGSVLSHCQADMEQFDDALLRRSLLPADGLVLLPDRHQRMDQGDRLTQILRHELHRCLLLV